MPRPAMILAAQLLGGAWTFPNTLIGLLAGAAGTAAGARAHFSPRHAALVFHRWPWGPGGAITLGNVILHTGEHLDSECMTYEHRAGHCRHAPIRIGDHERAHVYQYMVLGVLFLPVYLACGGISVRNPFERAADRYALSGSGWWPWRMPVNGGSPSSQG